MRSPQLENAVRQFVYAIRENPQFKEEAVVFLKAVEQELSVMQREISQYHRTVAELIEDERLYLNILQMYGVNLNKLGTKSIDLLKNKIEWAREEGWMQIPERLVPYVTIKKSEIGKREDYEWI